MKPTVLGLCRSQHPLHLQYASRFWNQAPECWASIYPVQQPGKHTHTHTAEVNILKPVKAQKSAVSRLQGHMNTALSIDQSGQGILGQMSFW